MRKFFYILVVLVVTGCTCDNIDMLPAVENITSMSASMWCNQESGPYSGPSIDEFDVSKEDYRKILDLFSCAKIDNNPCRWQGLGYVKIKTTSSSEIGIGLFWTGWGKGAFRIGDTYYRGSKDDEIVQVIIDCYKRHQGMNKDMSNMQIQPSADCAACFALLCFT